MKKQKKVKVVPIVKQASKPNSMSREEITKETERLDALDVESAKGALNQFLASPDWTRYGCRIVVQGQFIENQMNAGILVIKNK